MDKSNPCTCPICQSAFIPTNGRTGSEHLIQGVIAMYAEIQTKGEQSGYASICPRCGNTAMSNPVTCNAHSRHEAIQICDNCGTDEALRIFNNNVLPTAEWWAVREILGTIEPTQVSN